MSILSVNIIAPLITCYEGGFHLYVWADVLTVLPFIWLSAVVLVFITYPLSWSCGRPAGDDPPASLAEQRPGAPSGGSAGRMGNRHVQMKNPSTDFV